MSFYFQELDPSFNPSLHAHMTRDLGSINTDEEGMGRGK